MAIELMQVDERYEVDTEEEAERLIGDARREYNITKYSTTYKFKKSEEREYWIVTLRKDFS